MHDDILADNFIVGSVAAAEDLMDGIAAFGVGPHIISSMQSLEHIHMHLALWRAVQVVAAIHVAVDEIGFACVLVYA